MNGLGRLFIKMQGVTPKLDFRDNTERDEFLDYIGDTLYERLRQALLTWRGNKAKADEKAAKEPAKKVPDHIQRERDRAEARRETARTQN